MLCFSQYSNAQQIDPTTGNLIYTDANPPPGGYAAQGASWSGSFVGTNSNGGGTSGGNVPGFNPATGTWMFGYNQGTVSYSTSIPVAFANAGSGVLVDGYTYSWNYLNQDFSRGTLSANINIRSNTGAVLHSYNYNMPQTTAGWTNVSGVQNFGVQYNPLSLGSLNLSLTGKDDRWWAGYYGPQIKDVDVRLKYSVDPCVANPLYSSSCPGFNDIVTSGNLMGSNPSISWGQSFNEIIAISTALQHGGLGVKVHGFNWGYDVKSNDPYCAVWLILCLDKRDPLARTTVNITDSAGQSIYSVTRDYNDINSYQSKSYSYNLPNSTNSLSLGNFSIQGQTWDNAEIQNIYVNARYTPDQCVMNPLFSVSCTGYAEAFFQQQCSANPLYDQTCPGYAQAYYDQQCSTSALYDSGCPGYAAAYLTQQCSINTLYSASCPGYQQAYFNQQCSLNSLYNESCPGYAQAYFNQQCSLNPLYNESCPGYAQAYFDQQCQLNALYNSQCPGYAAAFVLQNSPSTAVESKIAVVEQPSTTSSLIVADPTRNESTVVVDAGGVELSTTGEISAPTGQTGSAKESIKEAAKDAEKQETKKEEEKKQSNPRAVAVARSAAAAATRLAESRAQEAVEISQLDQSVSEAAGLGTGITLQGFRPIGVSQDSSEESRTSERSSSQNNLNLQANNNTKTNEVPGSQPPTGPSVRRGGAVEGMEGGADMSTLAAAPADFNTYLNSQLKDSQFYTSREIYRGQRNVDNAAALRGLGSDRLHQRMVDQQYNIGQ